MVQSLSRLLIYCEDGGISVRRGVLRTHFLEILVIVAQFPEVFKPLGWFFGEFPNVLSEIKHFLFDLFHVFLVNRYIGTEGPFDFIFAGFDPQFFQFFQMVKFFHLGDNVNLAVAGIFEGFFNIHYEKSIL